MKNITLIEFGVTVLMAISFTKIDWNDAGNTTGELYIHSNAKDILLNV